MKRLAEGVRDSTVNRYLAVLDGMLSKAVEWAYLVENTVQRVKQYREDNRREYFLSEEEAKLLDACLAWLSPVVTIALHTCMRRGEMLGLRWRDVDFKNFKKRLSSLDTSATKGGRARKAP